MAGLRRMPMGLSCVVHRHREWVPIERHHVWPLGMGGPDVDSNKISVCANGHYAIHEYMTRLARAGGKRPDGWRHFSPAVRKYATQGWTEAGKP